MFLAKSTPRSPRRMLRMSKLSHYLLPLLSLVIALSCILSFSSSVSAAALVLLSDLSTPSIVLDMRALQRRQWKQGDETNTRAINVRNTVPSLHFPKVALTLVPLQNHRHDRRSSNNNNNDDNSVNKHIIDMTPFDIHTESEPAVGYLHTSVISTRDNDTSQNNKYDSTFLAEIDLPPSLLSGGNIRKSGSEDLPSFSTLTKQQQQQQQETSSPFSLAKLVLGLNNHHVISYYWARSAGLGSSMEAPGILYSPPTRDFKNQNKKEHHGGVLRWENANGPQQCNTNDGKRSEWVAFLRKGDTVQLVPACLSDAVCGFVHAYHDGGGGNSKARDDQEHQRSIRIYGISSEGRPLGSEPEVVCEWTCR